MVVMVKELLFAVVEVERKTLELRFSSWIVFVEPLLLQTTSMSHYQLLSIMFLTLSLTRRRLDEQTGQMTLW